MKSGFSEDKINEDRINEDRINKDGINENYINKNQKLAENIEKSIKWHQMKAIQKFYMIIVKIMRIILLLIE